MNWPVDIKDKFEFLRPDVYKDVNYSIVYGTDIHLPELITPSNQDMMSSNIAAYKAIKLKKYAVMNKADKKSSKTITIVKSKLSKYDAQIYANKQLNLTSLAYFKIKPANPSHIVTKNKEIYLSSEHFPIILLNIRKPNFENIEDVGIAINAADWELEYTVGNGLDPSPGGCGVGGSLGRRHMSGRFGNSGDGLWNVMV
jgi:hypothetical protein